MAYRKKVDGYLERLFLAVIHTRYFHQVALHFTQP
jgi:hypothetical protein